MLVKIPLLHAASDQGVIVASAGVRHGREALRGEATASLALVHHLRVLAIAERVSTAASVGGEEGIAPEAAAVLTPHDVADSLNGLSHLNCEFLFNVLKPLLKDGIAPKWGGNGLYGRFAREAPLEDLDVLGYGLFKDLQSLVVNFRLQLHLQSLEGLVQGFMLRKGGESRLSKSGL